MNTDALEWWFEEHNIPYHWLDSGVYQLDVSELSNETLREIASCDARIRVRDSRIFVEDSEGGWLSE